MLFVRCWNCLGVNLLFPAGRPCFILAWTGSRDETKLARGVWTFSCACFNRPKGERRITQAAFATLRRASSLHSARPSESAATKALRSRAFRPGNHTHKELALKGRPSESLSMNVAFGNHAWQSAAHSGRIYWRCFPRPECFRAWAVLFSPFGRRRNVQAQGTRRSSSLGRDEARPYQA
jgi:hypothetical protein